MTQIISAGTCGALVEIDENDFLIPTEALRCEGASYHYLPPERAILTNQTANHAIEKALQENSIPFTFCKTWTTDGFYRETKDMVQYRVSEGYSVVEMECAALAACAKFRNVIFGQMLFTADTLADVEEYDSRAWGIESSFIALKLCLDAVCHIKTEREG